MDNLKVHWNGTVPGHHHFSHLLLAEASTHQAIGQSSGSNAADHFHSVLTSLATSSGHTDSGSALTSQFILPVADHFGT